MRRAVVVLLALAGGAAEAEPLRSEPGPGPAAAVCLASPERALAWLDGVVSRARSLGLPAAGIEAVSRWMERELGADLLSPRDWRKAGLDPARPVCLSGPIADSGRVVITFGVTDAKKALDLARRLAARRDPAVGSPESVSFERAKAWTFAPKQGDVVLALAVRDRVGFLAASREDLAAGLATPDPGAGWDWPEGNVVVAARLDLGALGAVTGKTELARAAETTTPEVRADLVVAGREARLDVRGKPVGLLALAGGVLETTAPGAGRTALERLDGGASGFLQVRFPLRAILEALRTAQGQGASGGGPLLPAGWNDLAEALSGDLLLAAQDGLAGLTLTAGVSDEGAARRGIAGIGESLRASGVSVVVEEVVVSGAQAWRFRFGAEDSPLRFPVFVAVRDGLLTVSLSRSRLRVEAQAPEPRYLDALDHPLVREGIRSSGAVLVAHGYEADSFGRLLAYAAIVREALDGEAAAWMDLFDLVALATDLNLDSGAVATLSSSGWSVRAVWRFLGADPESQDPAERLFARAVRTRMEGRPAAARATLWTLAQAYPDGAWGRKARRCLVQPEPVEDFLVGAVIAGALVAWQARWAEAPEEEMTDEEAAVGEELPPCQQYLIRSCFGQDPEGPECRKARTFFEREDGPTAEDQEKCRLLLTR